MQALISKKVKRIVSLLTPLFAYPTLLPSKGLWAREQTDVPRIEVPVIRIGTA